MFTKSTRTQKTYFDKLTLNCLTFIYQIVISCSITKLRMIFSKNSIKYKNKWFAKMTVVVLLDVFTRYFLIFIYLFILLVVKVLKIVNDFPIRLVWFNSTKIKNSPLLSATWHFVSRPTLTGNLNNTTQLCRMINEQLKDNNKRRLKLPFRKSVEIYLRPSSICGTVNFH